MSARAILSLLDRPCVVREPSGGFSAGVLRDAWVSAGALRAAVDMETMTEYGRIHSTLRYVPATVVWFHDEASATHVRMDEMARRGKAVAG